MPETPDTSKIYVPTEHRIALCPGVEGVWNNGAYECFAATITAMLDMPGQEALLGNYGVTKKMHPREWRGLKNNDFSTMAGLGRFWSLFMAQRPQVKVAEDYLTCAAVAYERPEAVGSFISNPDNGEAYDLFFKEFAQMAARDVTERAAFKKLFYEKEGSSGRPWLQAQGMEAWQELNEPMPHALRGFRNLVAASKEHGGEGGGYVLFFVTTKPEEDSFILCDAYRRLGLMGEDEYSPTGGRYCMVSRDRIVGRTELDRIKRRIMAERGMKETTDEFDKWFKDRATAFQLGIVKEKMEDLYGVPIPFANLLKFDDRVDMDGLIQVNRKGAKQAILTDGYAFDFQLEKARENPFVDVIDGENMDVETGELVRRLGF